MSLIKDYYQTWTTKGLFSSWIKVDIPGPSTKQSISLITNLILDIPPYPIKLGVIKLVCRIT